MAKPTPPLRPWSFPLDVSESAAQPLYLQIARALTQDIQRGRLRPGTRLPGTRSLAHDLGVDRGTVEAAYDELSAEGWLKMRSGSGTYIAQDLETPARAKGNTVKRGMGIDLRGEPVTSLETHDVPQRTLSMASGTPDQRLIPIASLWRAYRHVLQRHSTKTLSYGDAYGHGRLRAAVATMVAEKRALAAEASDVLITSGSQMALYLLSRVLLRPGDVVAVEELGYRNAWLALRQSGATVVPVPVDARGLVVDALAAVAEHGRLRAVYVTPHHQYPTLATLTPSRRLQLLKLAERHRFAIIEDDYDHEFHYRGRPIAPLASLDQAGVVMYVGSLAKALAPGLRLGYVIAPRPVLAHLAAYRSVVDQHGNAAMECAVAELLEEGELQRHARRMRTLYRARQEALMAALRRELPQVVSFNVPPGGMALWVRVKKPASPVRWAAAARDEGVLIVPGREFHFAGKPVPYLRLGFACLSEVEIEEAVQRMKRGIK